MTRDYKYCAFDLTIRKNPNIKSIPGGTATDPSCNGAILEVLFTAINFRQEFIGIRSHSREYFKPLPITTHPFAMACALRLSTLPMARASTIDPMATPLLETIVSFKLAHAIGKCSGDGRKISDGK